MSEDEEKKVEGPLGPDPDKLYDWQPPKQSKIRTMRRVMEIELWIEKTGFVDTEEIIRYAMMNFNISRENAKHYLAKVIEDFRRLGLPVIGS